MSSSSSAAAAQQDSAKGATIPTSPSEQTLVPEAQKPRLAQRLGTWWAHVKPLIAAKADLDEDYNFASGQRSSWGGPPYNFPEVRRRGVVEEGPADGR